MSLRILAALTAFLTSSTAFAWSVPLYMCDYPTTPQPAGQDIPCSYTNEDGQTYNGVVTSSGSTLYCTGLVAPTPHDPTECASKDELLATLGEDPKSAPTCGFQGTLTKRALVCMPGEGGDDPGPQEAVLICGPDRAWCLELASFADCAAYLAAETLPAGGTCDDVQ